jgi:hypothetical protein
MTLSEFFLCVLALLVYSGPVIPMLAPLFFRRASQEHFRRNILALIILAALQGLSFLPYVFAVTTDKPDSLYRLYIPFGVGVLMFIGTSVFAICECIHLRSLIHSRHDA